MGVLISFTASAGTESALGASRVTRSLARLSPNLPLDLRLRDALKTGAGIFPVIERGAKTDAGARPALPEPSASNASPPPGTSADVETTGSIDARAALPEEEAGASEIAYDPAEGATPPIPRAIALASVTPAPAEAVPIEVAVSNLVLPGFTPRRDQTPEASALAPSPTESAVQNRFADLIAPDAMDREQRCLAEAVYFEARSEPEEGMAAVAQVVLNRVKSGLYPANVCGVVYQNRHRYMGCQFSFACEGKSLRITDAASWQTATRIAGAVIEGKTYLSEVGAATHYHADYVRPRWSRRLKKNDIIGRHIFYQLKRGQT